MTEIKTPRAGMEAALTIQSQTNQRLLDALERVKDHKMTPQEVFEQKVSFVSEGRDKEGVRQRLIEMNGYPAEASERAAIVAWLRETAAEYKAKTTAQQAVIEFNDNFSSTCGVAADAIEAGEHLK